MHKITNFPDDKQSSILKAASEANFNQVAEKIRRDSDFTLPSESQEFNGLNWNAIHKDIDPGYNLVKTSYEPLENEIVVISSTELAYGIWRYEYRLNKNQEIQSINLKGLYIDGILQRINHLGYFKRRSTGKAGAELDENTFYIREQVSVIEPVVLDVILDDFKLNYITCINRSIQFEYKDFKVNTLPEQLRELFYRQHHNIFNDRALMNLTVHDKEILKDGRDYSYFFFQNTIVKVSASELILLDYQEMSEQAIWKGHIIKRQLNLNDSDKECHFMQFIINVSNGEPDRIRAFKSAIGYLLHNYGLPTKGQCVIAYDEKLAKKGRPEGGSGKGLLANGIKQLRNTVKIDGKKFDPTDKFRWQLVGRQTQVVWLDDVKSSFPFEVLHSCLTDGWNIEKKHKGEIFIPPLDSPKVIIASNTVITNQGATNKRRQFVIEFSDHYSRHIVRGNEEPIRDEHGCMFFDDKDWSSAEWNLFYNYMLRCCQFYFAHGLQPYEHKSLAKNQLLQSTNEDFFEWIDVYGIQPNIDYDKKEIFADFKEKYGDDDLKQGVFTKWLKIYGTCNGLKVKQDRKTIKFVNDAALQSTSIIF